MRALEARPATSQIAARKHEVGIRTSSTSARAAATPETTTQTDTNETRQQQRSTIHGVERELAAAQQEMASMHQTQVVLKQWYGPCIDDPMHRNT